MAVNLRGVPTVLLPGTGSDDDFVYRAFSDPLHQVNALVITPTPQPGRLIEGYLQAIEDAARQGPVAVGGVSIGAVVAVNWALAHPGRAVAVLAALPPWTGAAGNAPAAVAARYTAHTLRSDGLVATTKAMQASSPPWLGDDLARSWLGQWPALPDAMEQAAGYAAPTIGELETLRTPMGVASAVDDAVHPVEVGAEWVNAAPLAALRTLTLAEIGAQPSRLGATCLEALLAV